MSGLLGQLLGCDVMRVHYKVHMDSTVSSARHKHNPLLPLQLLPPHVRTLHTEDMHATLYYTPILGVSEGPNATVTIPLPSLAIMRVTPCT